MAGQRRHPGAVGPLSAIRGKNLISKRTMSMVADDEQPRLAFTEQHELECTSHGPHLPPHLPSGQHLHLVERYIAG